MKKHKLVIICMVIVLTIGSFSFSASANFFDDIKGMGIKSDGKPIRVALSSAEFIAQYTISIFEYARKLLEVSGAEIVSFSNANWDAFAQASVCKDLLEMDLDALIIQPVDEHAIVSVIQELMEKGVEVICVNRDVATPVNLSIGINNELFGEALADLLYEWSEGKPVEILETQGGMELEIASGRSRGFSNKIKEYDNLTMVSQVPCQWQSDLALDATLDAVQANENLNAIFTHSDCMVPGIISALQQLEKLKKVDEEGHIFVGGVDGAPEGVDAVKKGYYDVTLEQNSFIFAIHAAKAVLYKASTGKSVNMVEELVEPIKVTLENAFSDARYANFDLKSEEPWLFTKEVWDGIDFDKISEQTFEFVPPFN